MDKCNLQYSQGSNKMKTTTNFIMTRKLFLIVLLIPTYVFSQEFGFKISYTMGSPESLYLMDDNRVYKITSTIDEIYVFKTGEQAKIYMKNINLNILPPINYQIGNAKIHLHESNSVTYYMNDSNLGSQGNIKSINDIVFTYANNSSWNNRSGVTGKLTKIGNTPITYHTASGYTEKGGYRGKIKSVGDKNFIYEGWTGYGEKIGIVGKLIKIGDVKINYYKTDYDKGFQGKLKSIGAVKFNYFIENAINKKAGIVGKFKDQTGKDSRIVIYPFQL